MVSNEPKANTKNELRGLQNFVPHEKALSLQRLVLTASFALVEKGFLSFNYHICIVT